jgi:hypothetical protein
MKVKLTITASCCRSNYHKMEHWIAVRIGVKPLKLNVLTEAG